jgi:hypothetical protein
MKVAEVISPTQVKINPLCVLGLSAGVQLVVSPGDGVKAECDCSLRCAKIVGIGSDGEVKIDKPLFSEGAIIWKVPNLEGFYCALSITPDSQGTEILGTHANEKGSNAIIVEGMGTPLVGADLVLADGRHKIKAVSALSKGSSNCPRSLLVVEPAMGVASKQEDSQVALQENYLPALRECNQLPKESCGYIQSTIAGRRLAPYYGVASTYVLSLSWGSCYSPQWEQIIKQGRVVWG